MDDQLRISGGRMGAPLLPAAHEQGLKCPRCDSPNTKFCYYNNYSLSQPRHFCKTCRRYWTRGGALRNVPVGGGCRKNKKFKSPASSRLRADPVSTLPETVSPGAGFLAAPRLQAPVGSQVLDVPPNYAAALISSGPVPVVGFCTYPVSITGVYSDGGGTSAPNNSCMESSMESLIGSMNQDLRWNLSVNSGGDQARNLIPESAQRPSSSSMQWFPEIAYPVQPSGSSSTINNSNSSSNAKTSTSYWNGLQAWNETPQFTALP